MHEIYSRMMNLIQHSLKEIRSENQAKETYLRGKDTEHKKKLVDCIDDISNDYLLSGEIEVKVLRTPNGKKVGPGTYDGEDEDKRRQGHNIMGYPGKKATETRQRSNSKSKGKNASFVETQSKSVSSSEDQIKNVVKVNVKKLSPGKTSMFKLVRDGSSEMNKENSEMDKKLKDSAMNESYELRMSLKQEERRHVLGETKRTLEKYRKIVEESHSLLNKTGDIVSSFRVDDVLGIDTTAEQTQGESEKDGEAGELKQRSTTAAAV